MSSLDLAFCFERNLAMPCMQNANAGPSQPESECMTQRRLWAGSVAATRRQAYAGYRLPCFRFRIAWTDGEAIPNSRAMARTPLPCLFRAKTSPARWSNVAGRPSLNPCSRAAARPALSWFLGPALPVFQKGIRELVPLAFFKRLYDSGNLRPRTRPAYAEPFCVDGPDVRGAALLVEQSAPVLYNRLRNM